MPRARELLAWLSVVALAAWVTWPGLALLAISALSGLAALVPAIRSERRMGVGLVVVLTGVLLALIAEGQHERLASDWPRYWSQREAAVVEELELRLDVQLEQGARLLERVAMQVELGKQPTAAELRAWQREAGVSAAAIHDSAGRALVWAGEHQGRLPEEVRTAQVSLLHVRGTLVSHLYGAVPLAGVGSAAFVLQLAADPLVVQRSSDALVERFRRATGEQVEFERIDETPEGRADQGRAAQGRADQRRAGATVYRASDGTPLLALRVVPPAPEARRSELRRRAGSAVSLVVLIAWLALTFWSTRGGRSSPGAALSALALALLLPIDQLVGSLPAGAVRTAGVGVGLWLVGAVLLPRIGRPLSLRVASVGVALLLPPALLMIDSLGLSPGALDSSPHAIAHFVLAAGATALLLHGAAALASGSASSRRVDLAALAIIAALMIGAGVSWAMRTPPSVWGLLPLGAVLPALVAHRREGSRAPLARLLRIAVVAALVVVPFEGARLIGERARAGAVDAGPEALLTEDELQRALLDFAGTAQTLDRGLAPASALLYDSWSRSALARTAHGLVLTLRDVEGQVRHLRIGTPSVGLDPEQINAPLAIDPSLEFDAVTMWRAPSTGVRVRLDAALASGRLLSASVMRSTPGLDEAPIGSLLAPSSGEPRSLLAEPLPRASVQWAVVSLLVALSIGLLTVVGGLALWVGGHTPRLPPQGVRGLVSFRARITVALFSFFAASNLIFGSLAYRAIDDSAMRTAEVLAAQIVREASGSYLAEGGRIRSLAQRVGADLIEYREGSLRDASDETLADLGLYPAWLPWAVHRTLQAPGPGFASAVVQLGGRDHVVAYRRLPDDDVLAAPVPLQAGAAALRSTELAALLSAAVLLGGLFSLVLALLVGRALSRPIQRLREASERVGRGQLAGEALPVAYDEFGSVFEAFNRMVERLQSARSELLRTTRRTEAIIQDAATGVVAFDAEGRITLANERARELLDLELSIGEHFTAAPLGEARAERGAAAEFRSWMRRQFEAHSFESSTEVQHDARRLRVRARRITQQGVPAGWVAIVEDVTDELRSERILAWGEMARQVAHEVKNPLTPIKLSVQHLRRAWHDHRPDFGDILERNSAAMLREIDRLAEIATAFSRFGAPEAHQPGPPQSVDLPRVVEDVLALYASGTPGIEFSASLPSQLPPVRARSPELKEVLVNLLENARAAVGPEGRVHVSAEYFVAAGRPDRVRLSVSDNGSGIPEELLPRIFEPHFSTRSAGTGLGLAIVHRLVESWGAHIQVESAPGQGTRFTIDLVPAHDLPHISMTETP